MGRNQDITRGRTAEQLLGNPVLQEAFDAVRDQLNRSWQQSQYNDHQTREAAYQMLHALEAVRAQLTVFVNSGKLLRVEEAQHEAERKRQRELKDWDGSPDGNSRQH